MPVWIITLTFASAFGTTMLAAGTRMGRQRTIAALLQMLEQGTFRVVSAEGKPVPAQQLASVLGPQPSRPVLSSTAMITSAIAVACLAALLAALIVRSWG